MALSNWDTFTVDVDGNPSDGSFTTQDGLVTVSFYKNWLYVRSEKMWVEGCGYSKPTIAQIETGHLNIGGLHIVAARGPKSGVYAVAYEDVYEKDKPSIVHGIAGIGCYGFDDHDWVGVEQAEIDYLKDLIKQWCDPDADEVFLNSRFMDIPFNQGQRFNQGDAYLIGKMLEKSGVAATPKEVVESVATKPGESEPTIMSKIIDNMEKK